MSYAPQFAEVDTAGAGSVKLASVVKYLKPRIDGKVLKAMFSVASKLPSIKAKKSAITLAEFDIVIRLVALQQSQGAIQAGLTEDAIRALTLPAAVLKFTRPKTLLKEAN